jgi:uncharacterized phage-associated protein
LRISRLHIPLYHPIWLLTKINGIFSVSLLVRGLLNFLVFHMYNSHQIANHFIKSSQATGQDLTPMKLIKLCYIAHGWHLGLFDDELLDEVVYAWKYGPVIDTIYKGFRKYGDTQITQLYSEVGCENVYPMPGERIKPFLDSIWISYGKYDGIQLSAMTHQRDTPWDIVWNKQGGNNKAYAIIPNDLIKSHYKEKIKELNVRIAARTSGINSTAASH